MNENDEIAIELAKLLVQTKRQSASYIQLLTALAGVVKGDIERTRCLVDLTNLTWTVMAVGQSPVCPASINGLPVIVLAGPDPKDAQLAAASELVSSLRAEIKQLKASAPVLTPAS